MSNQDEKDYVIRAMQSYKGDDLERADMAFGDFTYNELGQLHGDSGKTRNEIWQGYKDDREKWLRAMQWLENAQ